MKVILVFVAIILIACGELKKEKRAFNFYPALSETSGQYKYLVSEREKRARQFNLPTILHGVDSLEIRFIPINNFSGIAPHLFQFRVDSLGWRGYHYFSNSFPVSGRGDSRQRYSNFFGMNDSVFLVQDISPLNGWEKFMDSLRYFDMLHFPGREEIKGFDPQTWVEGHRYGYEVEIATKNSYRYIEYHIPELYKDSTNQKFSEIVRMIKRQIGDKYEWPLNFKNEY